ncbi:alpha/beta fold hydrolase [Rickettsiella massiliensis]|uniref:alpha/beta fold hydrolase n=1 Tax=Rickettsiella massiliensis TaxID=676517 RepID=UPI00029AB581|nr:alpha/beta hydrolase [Rickettsiella massiliensis]
MLDLMEQKGSISPERLDYIVSQFYAQEDSVERAQHLRDHLINLTADRLRRSIAPLGRLIFGRPNRLPFLTKINVPSLVITGEKDKSRPPSKGEHMAKILNCTHDAGHISNQE